MKTLPEQLQEESDARALRFAIRWDTAMCEYERAARTLRTAGYTDEGGEYWKPPLGVKPFQQRATDWARECFGEQNLSHLRLRAARFLEEAIELAQAHGLTVDDVMNVAEYVCNRPPGDPIQETGGVIVTLAVLCEVAGIHMTRSGEHELNRVQQKIQEIRERDKNKTYIDIPP
jgi:hypothetical protein